LQPEWSFTYRLNSFVETSVCDSNFVTSIVDHEKNLQRGLDAAHGAQTHLVAESCHFRISLQKNQPESTGSAFKDKTFDKESGSEIGPNGLIF
jgi:hypothetical protein